MIINCGALLTGAALTLRSIDARSVNGALQSRALLTALYWRPPFRRLCQSFQFTIMPWRTSLVSGNSASDESARALLAWLILCRLAKYCDASIFAWAAKLYIYIEPHDVVRCNVARIKDSIWFYFLKISLVCIMPFCIIFVCFIVYITAHAALVRMKLMMMMMMMIYATVHRSARSAWHTSSHVRRSSRARTMTSTWTAWRASR